MKKFENVLLNIPNAEPKVEIIHLPTVEVAQDRYDELIAKEAQLDFVKKWLHSNARYYNYADVSDLLLLLDIEKEQEKKTNEK